MTVRKAIRTQDHLTTLISTGKTYMEKVPAAAMVYFEQAWNLAIDLDLAAAAETCQNAYYECKERAFS